jgi:ATP-binding cassette subfamily C exporter for protease/lipase
MPTGTLTVHDEAVAPPRRIDEVRQALAALWPHFLWLDCSQAVLTCSI